MCVCVSAVFAERATGNSSTEPFIDLQVNDTGSYLEFTPPGQEQELAAAGATNRPLVGVSQRSATFCVVSWRRTLCVLRSFCTCPLARISLLPTRRRDDRGLTVKMFPRVSA